MSDPALVNARFDRTAVTILGAMLALIAALSVVLVERSVASYPDHVPMAAAGVPKAR